ncbi:hypothetical protein BBK82_38505 [Lentzea guizhouensis]|uniref:Two-component sensor histidine kinase n=1 Tax=Lentzea guizhouensis TaxID=1586287 RepID=A0A1B2HTE4_9PSEU|nr:hypothetical protein [Lentzea guizhouensis]ANZ41000.1 hypothetical protein BBK82_38505 [Lentzea guizhouensis]
MRRSVFTRLLLVVVLIAVCSVAATAWLATQLTQASIAREQGRELAADNRIYAALLSYAAAHRDWSEVDSVLDQLVLAQPHRRIALLTKDGRTIADRGGDGGQLPATAAAVVDPLAVDPVLVPGAPADRIDERVLGPFRTPIDFREREDRTGTLQCLRARKQQPGPKDCRETDLEFDTAADFSALLELEDLVNACLARKSLPPVELDPDHTPARKQLVPDEPAAAACVTPVAASSSPVRGTGAALPDEPRTADRRDLVVRNGRSPVPPRPSCSSRWSPPTRARGSPGRCGR